MHNGLLVFGHVSLAANTKWELLDGQSRAFLARRMETVIQDCSFPVDQRMLLLARETQRPCVHGGVLGTWRDELTEQLLAIPLRKTQVTYAWQKEDVFRRQDTGEIITSAKWILLDRNGCWVIDDDIAL